jgi:predicted kinase
MILPTPPRLILVAGTAAVGKTVFTHKLVQDLSDSILIDKDTINDGFSWKPAGPDGDPITPYRRQECLRGHPSWNEYYTECVKYQTYDTMIRLAKDNLLLSKHVVVDGNFQNELRIGYIENILVPVLRGVHYSLKILHCRAPEEVVRQRMISRDASRDKSKLASDEAWRKHLKNQPIVPSELSRYEHLAVDTSVQFERQVSDILKYLAS